MRSCLRLAAKYIAFRGGEMREEIEAARDPLNLNAPCVISEMKINMSSKIEVLTFGMVGGAVSDNSTRHCARCLH